MSNASFKHHRWKDVHRGYTCASSNHGSYSKPPVSNFRYWQTLWLTSRSETRRQRNRLALVGPSLLSVDLSEGRKIGWLHPHPEMFWICTNATKTQTHISVYCALFICSEYNKRTLFLCCTVFVTECLSCSSDETGSFHVDSCCADCVKYFEKVNSRWRNSCQQI